MTTQIASRIAAIHAALGCQAAEQNITLYPRPGQPTHGVNLELQETWDAIQKLVAEADFIIIDHLTNVTTGGIDLASWRRLWKFIERLKQMRKSVLILHHAGKNGKQRGTSVLEADVDTIIRMEPLLDCRNGALITYEKHRDDASLGKNLPAMKLLWDKDEIEGTYRWWAEAAEATTKAWASFPREEERQYTHVDEEFLNANFHGRQAAIMTLLAKAILQGAPGLSATDIAKELGVSPSTARAELDSLIAQHNVAKRGKGRATIYTITSGMAKSVVHK